MRRSGKEWYRIEREVMERLGLSQVPGSGSTWVAREDGESDEILCQLKSTDAQSITIKLQDVHALEVHASQSHKLPVFAIHFTATDDTYVLLRPSSVREVAQALLPQTDPNRPKSQASVTCRIDSGASDLDPWEPPPTISSTKQGRDSTNRSIASKYRQKRRSAK